MDQPKFKFGDKVREGGQSPFIVGAVSFNEDSGSYTYTDKCFKPWHKEERLELVQEPRKKKLYAHKLAPADSLWERVDFFTSEKPADSCFKRAPEYDIEYPEPK